MNVVSDRALRHRAEQLVTLGKLESFGVLREIAQEQARLMERILLARLHVKGTDITDVQRHADYDRGFVDGMRYVTVELVAKANRKLAHVDEPAEEPEEDRWRYE